MENSPSLQQRRDLYHAAIEFKKIEPWQWMDDSDLFGVQNPQDGQIGYCCVLGALGQVFGLALYLGEKGLGGYLKIQSGEIPPEDIDALYIQDCLMASFDDRKLLEKSDLKIIKSLGLNFRGSKAWPLFRRYEPGYQPWYLNKEETMFLTIALQQAKEVAFHLRENRDLLNPPMENHCLVRVAKYEGETLNWKNEWSRLPTLERRVTGIPVVDQLRLHRLKKKASFSQVILEVDSFFAPFVIQEGEKPFFPHISLWVDHRSGLVLKHHLSKREEFKAEFQNEILNLFEEVKSLPSEIRVRQKESFKLLEPITSTLGIKLKLVKKLLALEDAKEHMKNYFLSGRFK